MSETPQGKQAPTEAEVNDVHSEINVYIERIFNNPEEYRQALNSVKFSDPIAEHPNSSYS